MSNQARDKALKEAYLDCLRKARMFGSIDSWAGDVYMQEAGEIKAILKEGEQ